MRFIKPDINIDFISKRKIGFVVSAIMILISLISLIIHKGPRYGIDFAGGTLIQVKFGAETNIDTIKSGLAKIDLKKSTVQRFGEKGENEYIIRTDKSVKTFDDLSNKVRSALTSASNRSVDVRRIEMVGPQVGKDLREKALFAMFYALLFIAIYISGRFELKWVQSGIVAGVLGMAVYTSSLLNISIPLVMTIAIFVTIVLFWILELKYAMGAIVALIHDVIITIGIFSIFDKEFTLPIIAALLTIIGYSLNDTIIVFDRIRENYKNRNKKNIGFIINKSINETLSRTILTSLTTLIVVVSLFVLGGGIIHDFAFALIVGILVGTYSSIFVASPILLTWQKRVKIWRGAR